MNPQRRIARVDPRHTPLESGFDALWAVAEQVQAGYHFPQKKLNYLTFELTLSGTAVTRCGGNVIELQADSMDIMPSGIRFETQIHPTHDWTVHYLMISGRWARAIERDILGHQSKIFLYAQAPAVLRDSLQQAVALILNQPPAWQWAFLHHFCGMVRLLPQSPSPIASPRDSIATVRQYVHQSPHRSWNVPELAAAMGISPSSLWHRFQSDTGQTPGTIVRQERMRIAQRLLKQGMNVTQVADYLGYSSPYSFSRSFKAETGVPPSYIKPSEHPK